MFVKDHGIRFTIWKTPLLYETRHTYYDWGIVPITRPVIQMPPDATPTVQIGGALYKPELRLTSINDGKPVFGMREGSWEFRVKKRKNWIDLFSEIGNFLQGQKVQIRLEDDKSFYYVGTVSVNEFRSDQMNSTIVLDYKCEPYKYDHDTSIEPWKWDPFSFYTGVIRNYHNLTVAGATDYTIIGSPMPVIPVFLPNSDGNGIKVYDTSVSPVTQYELWGETAGGDIIETNPDNLPITTQDGVIYDREVDGFAVEAYELKTTMTLRFVGTGTISIFYRGGRL